MKLSDEAIRRLGLDPATATDDEVSAAILASVTDDSGTGGEGDGATTGGDDGNTESQPQTPATAPTGEPATAPTTTPDTGGGEGEGGTTTTPTQKVPDGFALIDTQTLEDLKTGVAAARAQAEKSVKAERSKLLDDAIKAGKFPKARRGHYEALMAADPEGTTNLIGSLAAGVVPVEEIGTQGGDTDPGQQGDAYPESWKPAVTASKRGIGARVKVVND